MVAKGSRKEVGSSNGGEAMVAKGSRKEAKREGKQWLQKGAERRLKEWKQWLQKGAERRQGGKMEWKQWLQKGAERHCIVQITFHAATQGWKLGAKTLGAFAHCNICPGGIALCKLLSMQQPKDGGWVQKRSVHLHVAISVLEALQMHPELCLQHPGDGCWAMQTHAGL